MSSFRDASVSLACRILARPFGKAGSPLPSNPESVLVIKPCCLGDVLMATAVVGQLRRRYPEARIAFAVGPWSRAAIEGNEDVDAVVDCGPVGNGERFSWRDYAGLARRLRRGRFQVCYVLDRSPLLTLLPFLAGIPHRVGIDSGGRGFSLTHKAPWQENKHESELFMDTLRVSGWQPQAPLPHFSPSPEDRQWATTWLGLNLPPLANGAGLIAVHAGGGVNPGTTLMAKRWFPERFAAVVALLLGEGHPVVLVGAPGDAPVSEAVRLLAGAVPSSSARLLDLTGCTTFGQLGALIERCDLFVGNDSGPTHLATAVGTPVVAIFGPTDPAMYGPAGDRGISVYKKVDCSPCFIKGRFAQQCQDYRCLRAVEEADVLQAIKQVLRRGDGGSHAGTTISTPQLT